MKLREKSMRKKRFFNNFIFNVYGFVDDNIIVTLPDHED